MQRHNGSANCLTITSDNRYIVSGGHDSTVRVWTIDEKKQEFALEIQTYTAIYAIAVTSDIKYILAGSGDALIRIWSFFDKKLYATLNGHSCPVSSILITRDNQNIISAAQERTIRIWSIKQKAGEILIDSGLYCNYIAITNDDRYIAYCNQGYTIGLINLKERRKVDELQGHTNKIHGIAITRDNVFIVSASYDMTVRVWNLQERRLFAVLQHFDRCFDLCFSNLIITSYDNYIISVTKDRRSLLWTLPNLS